MILGKPPTPLCLAHSSPDALHCVAEEEIEAREGLSQSRVLESPALRLATSRLYASGPVSHL